MAQTQGLAHLGIRIVNALATLRTLTEIQTAKHGMKPLLHIQQLGQTQGGVIIVIPIVKLMRDFHYYIKCYSQYKF